MSLTAAHPSCCFRLHTLVLLGAHAGQRILPGTSYLLPWHGVIMKALARLFHLVPCFLLWTWKKSEAGGRGWSMRDKASLFMAESEDSQMESSCNLIAALITGTAATPTEGQERASVSLNFADTEQVLCKGSLQLEPVNKHAGCGNTFNYLVLNTA